MDECTKRRLPTWMLGAATADQVRSSVEEKRNVNNNVKEGTASQIVHPKSRAKARTKRIKKGVSLPEQELLESDPGLRTKCETKKRGRKLNQEDDAGGSDGKVGKTVSDENRCNRGGRKIRKRACGKRVVGENLRMESSEEIKTPSPGEDDGELTMDDLMSIAQEYIRTDEHTEKQRPSHIEQEVKRQFPAISLYGNESRGLCGAPQSNRRSPTHSEKLSVHSSTGTSAAGGTMVNPSRTGDPAQDMLDLFLGPLLKKPLGEENKMDLFKEDMKFGCEIKTQRQNNIAIEDVIPLTKKKSSLKDKVAFFLD